MNESDCREEALSGLRAGTEIVCFWLPYAVRRILIPDGELDWALCSERVES